MYPNIDSTRFTTPSSTDSTRFTNHEKVLKFEPLPSPPHPLFDQNISKNASIQQLPLPSDTTTIPKNTAPKDLNEQQSQLPLNIKEQPQFPATPTSNLPTPAPTSIPSQSLLTTRNVTICLRQSSIPTSNKLSHPIPLALHDSKLSPTSNLSSRYPDLTLHDLGRDARPSPQPDLPTPLPNLIEERLTNSLIRLASIQMELTQELTTLEFYHILHYPTSLNMQHLSLIHQLNNFVNSSLQ